MAKRKYFYVGILPEVFGYGMFVLCENEEDCEKAIIKDYKESYKSRNGHKPTTKYVKERMEYYGYYCNKVEIGKVYDEYLKC